MRSVVLDFETASTCDLKVAGAHRYAEDPTTEIVCLTYTEDDKTPVLWVPGKADAYLFDLVNAPDTIFVAHNAGFEKAIWRKIMVAQHGWPDVPNTRWHCTQAVCAMKALPQDLNRSLLVLRLSHAKDLEGSRITKALSKPNKKGYFDALRDPAVLRRVYEYNASDISGTVGLHARVGWLPPGERQVWLLDQRMNERGVRLDMAFVAKAQEIVDKASGPLLREFAELTDGLKPTQVQKVRDWCRARGAVIPDLKAETLKVLLNLTENEDAEDVDELSGEIDEGLFRAELPAEVHRALSIRQLIGSASIKKLRRMSLCVCEDGRARGILQYHGAGPGLWAGRLFQPQNFPRGTLKIKGKDGKEKSPPPEMVVSAIMSGDYEFVEATLGPAVEVVVSSLRHAIIASPGRAIVAGDFAGIQARAVLALAGQHDKTAIMASGQDIYIDMAQSIFKRTLNKTENPEERQVGKNTVLGLGFQMGARKFRLRYAKEHPLEFSENVVHVYRKEWAPLVPRVWYGLEGAAVRAVHDRRATEAYGVEYRLEDGWLTARLPSGRKLWYYNPVPTHKAMPWDADDIRLAWASDAMKFGQWRTRDMFGGLLTENVVMGMQRDLLTTAMFKCEKEGLPVILNVHDEIICEPEISRADPKLLAQIMQDIPDWAKAMQIPVSVEAWAGERYKK